MTDVISLNDDDFRHLVIAELRTTRNCEMTHIDDRKWNKLIEAIIDKSHPIYQGLAIHPHRTRTVVGLVCTALAYDKVAFPTSLLHGLTCWTPSDLVTLPNGVVFALPKFNETSDEGHGSIAHLWTQFGLKEFMKKYCDFKETDSVQDPSVLNKDNFLRLLKFYVEAKLFACGEVGDEWYDDILKIFGEEQHWPLTSNPEWARDAIEVLIKTFKASTPSAGWFEVSFPVVLPNGITFCLPQLSAENGTPIHELQTDSFIDAYCNLNPTEPLLAEDPEFDGPKDIDPAQLFEQAVKQADSRPHTIRAVINTPKGSVTFETESAELLATTLKLLIQ